MKNIFVFLYSRYFSENVRNKYILINTTIFSHLSVLLRYLFSQLFYLSKHFCKLNSFKQSKCFVITIFQGIFHKHVSICERLKKRQCKSTFKCFTELLNPFDWATNLITFVIMYLFGFLRLLKYFFQINQANGTLITNLRFYLVENIFFFHKDFKN